VSSDDWKVGHKTEFVANPQLAEIAEEELAALRSSGVPGEPLLNLGYEMDFSIEDRRRVVKGCALISTSARCAIRIDPANAT